MYRAMRWLLHLALGFYFRRIERFHPERVPAHGPVLFTSNHPNSLTDSFVIGASVTRKVNFVATVQLFRARLLRWLLGHCGVIPINRVKDDARAMRTVADTFAACFRVLEAGEAIGIFPEGVTYDDSELKEIKSGAARMALEAEQRNGGRLGLEIVPVGLSYSAKELYRSEVLVCFGEPIGVSEYLPGYAERRKECIQKLTTEIERRIRALILNLPQLEQGRVVRGVTRLYSEPTRVGNRIVAEPSSSRAEELLWKQRIAEAVERAFQERPEQATAFAHRLACYERWLARMHIADEDLARHAKPGALLRREILGALVLLIGAPIALYGWLHRFIPFAVVRWAVGKFTLPATRKAQASTVMLVAGVVLFGGFYGACVLGFHLLFGWPATLWYALSLPVASLLAHYYSRELRGLIRSARNAMVLLRAPTAARRLLAQRKALVAEIEAMREKMAV